MNVGSHPWHFSMLEKKKALREGILTKRMPANQRVETRGGKKVGKEREVVSLQKGAQNAIQVYNFSKTGH